MRKPTPETIINEPIRGEWHWSYRLPGPMGSVIHADQGVTGSSASAGAALDEAAAEGDRKWLVYLQQFGLPAG